MSPPPAVLLVNVASPAQFTGASATGTTANTDVVTDEHGLPYLPRHRLAARLREGATSAVLAEEELLAGMKRLFGTTNGGHEAHRLLRIGHAHPAEPVRAAVAWAVAQRDEDHGEDHDRQALVRAVTAAYTTEESGTEVDTEGAPVGGRLRTNRVLLPGLRLVAELRWAADPTDTHLRCLARAALATTTAGLRVTRGRGRVDVRPALTAGTDLDSAHTYTLGLAALTPSAGTRQGAAR